LGHRAAACIFWQPVDVGRRFECKSYAKLLEVMLLLTSLRFACENDFTKLVSGAHVTTISRQEFAASSRQGGKMARDVPFVATGIRNNSFQTTALL
jgi:hypothetical protein